jgi:hypothetical protein
MSLRRLNGPLLNRKAREIKAGDFVSSGRGNHGYIEWCKLIDLPGLSHGMSMIMLSGGGSLDSIVTMRADEPVMIDRRYKATV